MTLKSLWHTSQMVQTFGAVLLAFFVWILCYVLAFWALSILGLPAQSQLLDSLINEVLAPGIGAYAAMIAVRKTAPLASTGVVGTILCTPVTLMYIGVSVYMIALHSDKYDFVWSEQALNWLIAIATCVGAYVGATQEGVDVG